MKLAFTLHGEPASLKNSREIVVIGARKRQVITGEDANIEYELKAMDVVVKDYDDGTIDTKRMLVLMGSNADTALELETMRVGGRPLPRKSDKALDYEGRALPQIRKDLRLRLEGNLRLTMRMFYASNLSDMDEAIVLDVLQDRYEKNKITGERKLVREGVYRNDRQVRERHVYHAIDKANPRVEIEIETMDIAQQGGLELREPVAAENPF